MNYAVKPQKHVKKEHDGEIGKITSYLPHFDNDTQARYDHKVLE